MLQPDRLDGPDARRLQPSVSPRISQPHRKPSQDGVPLLLYAAACALMPYAAATALLLLGQGG